MVFRESNRLWVTSVLQAVDLVYLQPEALIRCQAQEREVCHVQMRRCWTIPDHMPASRGVTDAA